jgi:2-polyprenyl-6-methoxyphenol hydroxylase-like FAD-dependent oxidoreductase
MNTGIQDAISLASALQSVIQQGNDAALSTWHEERLAIAHSVVTLIDRMTKLATASSSGVKLLRNAMLRVEENLMDGMPRIQNHAHATNL